MASSRGDQGSPEERQKKGPTLLQQPSRENLRDIEVKSPQKGGEREEKLEDPQCRASHKRTVWHWNLDTVDVTELYLQRGRLYSDLFSLAGVPDLQLSLQPQSEQALGKAALFLHAPEGCRLKFRLELDGVSRTFELHEFRHLGLLGRWLEWSEGWGAVDLGPASTSFQGASVELLEAWLPAPRNGISGELVEKKKAAWNLRGISFREEFYMRGAAVRSPSFSLAHVPNLSFQLLPHSDLVKHKAALYLQAPDSSFLRFNLALSGHSRTVEIVEYETGGLLWGFHDICPAGATFSEASVELLEVWRSGRRTL